ncbi:outer membrane beta-barrel protein [Larkinella insperata]|uniref:Outer membrane beta-barrel protein n=1 Tax=Larkinella insperata TaxID=332158 RepID=A0ABW3QK85_9BACT|nr:outer membrane beta-barrel protein [Larkinella insperata]
MKSSLLTVCLVAVGLLAEAQTTKPKTTAPAAKPQSAATAQKKPAATAPKKTTTAYKPKTTAKKPVAKPAVATAPKAATTAVASAPAAAETEPVLAQQTAVETTPVEAVEKETGKRSKKSKAEKPEKTKAPKAEKVAKVKPEQPARVKTENTYSGKGLSVGIRGGANAWLNEFVSEDMGSNGEQVLAPGFTGGLVINYGLGNVFSIQPEILYTRRSVKTTGEAEGQKASLILSTSAIEVPLLLKLSFGRKVRVFVNAGPYAAYGLDARAKLVVNGETVAEDTQKLTKDDARLEYGATGGLGVAFPVGPGRLTVEGRYTYSLGTNADPQPAGYISQQISTVSVGYVIPLGRK